MTASECRFPVVHGYAAKAKDQPLVAWEYTPRPLGPNDIEIKIDHCGICGSDLHTIDSGWGPTNYPVIVGHEIIGHVATTGSDVREFKVGDLVGVGAQAFACHQPDCPACSRGRDPQCPHSVSTYNSRYPDGQVSQGGYAEAVRVDHHYAFHLPTQMDPEVMAPLMCAGTTVFTPMMTHGVKKGDRFGVIGIGGLGHLAVQFARALSTEVTAFTTSENKRPDCEKLGAHKVVNIKNEAQVKAARNSLDFLLVSTNSPHTDWNQLTDFMDVQGTIIVVAAPEADLVISPFKLLLKALSVSGSLIGGVNDVRHMLEFAAKHNIRPWIERLPMDKCNDGIDRMRSGKIRYRIVLSNPTQK
ncbi:hypothetical protein H4R33_005024 [Dimargaris cristalligena]|nr:hypothetical protein H4R33_005024 [Dimargaris cristalligena]